MHKDFCLLNFNPPGPCICAKALGPYTVTMKETATGEVRTFPAKLPWGDGSNFWWSEGNYSCDCNRELEWREAGGLPRFPEIEGPCTEGRYVVLSINLPDGTQVYAEQETKKEPR